MKSLLKKIKLNESTISMILGAIVIVVVGVLVINYFRGIDTGSTIPALETEQAEGELPTTHIVEAGENLWTVSEEYYGTGYNWVDIAEANEIASPGTIEEGQELTIPDVEAKAVGSELADATGIPEATTAPTEEPTPEPTAEPTATPTPEPTEAMEEEVIEEEVEEDAIAMEEVDETDTTTADNQITGDTYTVVHGDTLWDIADRAYGDPYRWVDIAEANDLVNPNLIHPGNVFTLPR